MRQNQFTDMNEVWQTEHYSELGNLSQPVSMGAAPLPFWAAEQRQ